MSGGFGVSAKRELGGVAGGLEDAKLDRRGLFIVIKRGSRGNQSPVAPSIFIRENFVLEDS